VLPRENGRPPVSFSMVICDFFPGSGEVVPCAHQGKEKSRRYVLDMQARLHFAAKTFTANIADIKTAEMDKWLASMKKNMSRTKNN